VPGSQLGGITLVSNTANSLDPVFAGTHDRNLRRRWWQAATGSSGSPCRLQGNAFGGLGEATVSPVPTLQSAPGGVLSRRRAWQRTFGKNGVMHVVPHEPLMSFMALVSIRIPSRSALAEALRPSPPPPSSRQRVAVHGAQPCADEHQAGG